MILGGSISASALAGVSPASASTVVQTIPVGNGPVGVSSDGAHVWVVNLWASAVTELNASSGAFVRTIPVGSGASGVSSDGTHVWVTNYSANTVTEIDASTGAVVQTIPVGNGPSGVSSDDTHVWVANLNSNTVTELNASDGSVVRTLSCVSVSCFYGFNGPDYISSDGNHVWVTNSTGNTVTEMDASDGSARNIITVGHEPLAISSDRTDVWVANYGDNSVSELNASTGAVVRTIPVSSGANGGVSSDGTHVWVTSYTSPTSTVTELNASTGAVVQTISVGNEGLGISSDGTDVWVANQNDNTVSQISVATAITGVSFTGTTRHPTVTITGTGFGTAPSSSPTGCNATGNQYVDQELYIQDVTAGWTAGQAGNCIGLIVSSYTNTQIVLSFGSFYDTAPYRFALAAGDQFSVGVVGATATGTVEFPKIHSVKIVGSNYLPTVTITGTGFGSAPASAALTPGCGSSGSDYALGDLYFNDITEAWQAGEPGNCVGLVVSSYSDTTIVLTFGSTYTTNGWFVDAHDVATIGVAGAAKTVKFSKV